MRVTGVPGFRHFIPLFLIAFPIAAEVDVFGITRLLKSASPPLEWNSAHWAKGGTRTLNPTDPHDTTGWSRRRGNGTLNEVDGAGVYRMGGDQPRIYFQSAPNRPLFFHNVEFTVYYRRVGTDGATNGGLMVGVRSSENGHGDVDHCDAHTYYAGYRYPGTWIFYKELDHPNGATGASGRLFPGNMPTGKWIGLKYLSYNVPGRTDAVKLELHVDTASGGDPAQGGVWRKVAEIVDDGSWSAPAGSCGYPGNTVITRGEGVVFIRNTGAAEANYKMLSVREIVPPGTVSLLPAAGASDRAAPASRREGYRMLLPYGLPGASGSGRAAFDAAGRRQAPFPL